ncbi:oligosaccharide flippase family protein [Gemmatimonadota bacterium]
MTLGSTLKTLGKQTIVYSTGDLLVKSLSFLLIPILTQVWEPDGPEMGTYGLLHLAEAVAYLIFNLGLATAVIKVLSDYRHSRARSSVVFTTVGILATISMGLFILAWMAAPYIATPLLGSTIVPADAQLFLRLTFMATWFSTFRFVTMSILRVEGRPWLYTLLNIINFVTYVSVAIWLVVVEDLGVLGIVYANVTASVVMLAIVLGILQARWHRPFSMKRAGTLFSFGLPLLPNGLALWALALLDRWFLRILSPTPEIGISLTGQYDIAYRFGMIVSFLLIIPLRTAWLPMLFKIKDHEEAPALIGRLMTYVMVLGGGLALALSALAPEIIMIAAGSDWLAAAAPLPLIAFGYLAYGVSQVGDAGILARNRTNLYPLITITSVAVNATLCALMIPSMGMMGAAWATLIAYCWHALLISRVSWSISPFHLEWKRLVIVFGTGAVILVATRILPEMGLWGSVMAKTGVLLLYPFLLWVFGFLSADERKALAGLRAQSTIDAEEHDADERQDKKEEQEKP